MYFRFVKRIIAIILFALFTLVCVEVLLSFRYQNIDLIVRAQQRIINAGLSRRGINGLIVSDQVEFAKKLPNDAAEPDTEQKLNEHYFCHTYYDRMTKFDKEQLAQLKKVLDNLPIKAVFYTIAISAPDAMWIVNTVRSNMNSMAQYPFVIFHEGIMDINPFGKLNEQNVFLQRLHHEIPAHIPESFVPPNVTRYQLCQAGNFIGYKGMIRFSAIVFPCHPVASMIDWYLRLDTDSQIHSLVTFDIFEHMQNKQLIYGFSSISHDNPLCIQQLDKTVHDFARLHKLNTSKFDSRDPECLFFNNFEVSSMAFWQQPIVTKYLRYIDDAGGIFYYRWGDAPIKTAALLLLADWVRFKQFPLSEVDYHHNGIVSPEPLSDCVPKRFLAGFVSEPPSATSSQ